MSESTAKQDDLTQFHDDLLALRAAAGAPSYARLARRTGQPRSTVYDAFRRSSLPAAELLEALVTALDGDSAAWRARWTKLRAQADLVDLSTSNDVIDAPNPGPRTPSDVTGRDERTDGADVTRRAARRSLRPWWAAVAGTAVVAAAAGVFVTRWTAEPAAACTSYRVYRANDDGSVLDRNSVDRGRVARGDLILVSAGAVKDHTFHARYPSIDVANGRRGYVDESKLVFLRDQGCL